MQIVTIAKLLLIKLLTKMKIKLTFYLVPFEITSNSLSKIQNLDLQYQKLNFAIIIIIFYLFLTVSEVVIMKFHVNKQ